jgi:hypothetical protein
MQSPFERPFSTSALTAANLRLIVWRTPHRVAFLFCTWLQPLQLAVPPGAKIQALHRA